MELSIFEVVGPVMIGPSSSHTAGAAKLARAARRIMGKPFTHVDFALHGSFAQTYKGHGTDRALVAGILDMAEDDPRLADSFALAEQAGITFAFHPADLGKVHENTVRITFSLAEGGQYFVQGSSLGGGRIVITNLNGTATEISAASPTVIVTQQDVPGVVSDVSTILAFNHINIGVMKVTRQAKGGLASCIIECDDPIPEKIEKDLRRVNNVLSVQVINP